MPQKCPIQNCTSETGRSPGVSFFSFPSNSELASAWLHNLRIGLPSHYTVEHCRHIRICSLHFPVDSYYAVGSRRLLFRNAIPLFIDPGVYVSTIEPDKDAEEESESNKMEGVIVKNVISEDTSTNKASSCDFTSTRIAELEKELANVKRDLNNLQKYPPASFIIEHLDVLQSHVSPEAYVRFISSVKNHNLDSNGRGRTYASKRLANIIDRRSKTASNPPPSSK